jgi:nitrite reductase (NADH) small subunit
MNEMSVETKTQVWVEVCKLVDIPPQGSRVIRATLGCVALFRTADDKVFALEDRCPHKGGPLSQGIVHENGVTCPLHNWVIDMETGRAKAPDEGRVRTFPVDVRDGKVLIDRALLA